MNLRAAIILSLFLHLILSLGLILSPVEWLSSSDSKARSQLVVSKATPLEVSILDKIEANDNHQQIIREAKAPEDQVDKDSKDLARFLSANNQRVLLETRAKLSGQTNNRIPAPKYQRQLLEKKMKSLEQELKKLQTSNTSSTEVETATHDETSSIEYKPMNLLPQQKYGVSTFGESVPDNVSIGDFTALNTDQFQFYTFYARVENLVRFRWENKIRETIETLDRRQALKNTSQNEWISQIEFTIDDKGFLRKALILRESGIQKFDEAAIFAFEDAKIFPNPPKEMLKDGVIHIRYAFHVNYKPTYVAR